MPKGQYESQFRKNSGRANGHRPSVEERFWQKVNKDGPIIRPDLGPCWEWTGARFRRVRDGSLSYGQFQFEGRPHNAHRVAWALANGPIEAGVHVLHHCDNEACVRLEHLFVGSDSDNMRDMAAKGRSRLQRPFNRATGDRHGMHLHPERVRRGEAHPKAVLTEHQVTEMRRLHRAGTPQVELARLFAIDKTLVSKIVNKLIWKHVPDELQD